MVGPPRSRREREVMWGRVPDNLEVRLLRIREEMRRDQQVAKMVRKKKRIEVTGSVEMQGYLHQVSFKKRTWYSKKSHQNKFEEFLEIRALRKGHGARELKEAKLKHLVEFGFTLAQQGTQLQVISNYTQTPRIILTRMRRPSHFDVSVLWDGCWKDIKRVAKRNDPTQAPIMMGERFGQLSPPTQAMCGHGITLGTRFGSLRSVDSSDIMRESSNDVRLQIKVLKCLPDEHARVMRVRCCCRSIIVEKELKCRDTLEGKALENQLGRLQKLADAVQDDAKQHSLTNTHLAPCPLSERMHQLFVKKDAAECLSELTTEELTAHALRRTAAIMLKRVFHEIVQRPMTHDEVRNAYKLFGWRMPRPSKVTGKLRPTILLRYQRGWQDFTLDVLPPLWAGLMAAVQKPFKGAANSKTSKLKFRQAARKQLKVGAAKQSGGKARQASGLE